ncbi:MAG: acyl carrier protein [Ardenticatenaceae bacterium]|nr:acyl carrier protein [Ardenticatenaceae bacterium]
MEQLKQDQVTEKLLTVLSKHLKFADDPQAIPMDKPLDELGLDSMGAVNLLLDLEDSFEISFPGSLLSEDTFKTAANLHKAVASLV